MSSFKVNNSSGNEVDLYGGFTNKLALYDSNAMEDEAYQNVIKNSSYGRKNTTTPKFGWVKS